MFKLYSTYKHVYSLMHKLVGLHGYFLKVCMIRGVAC